MKDLLEILREVDEPLTAEQMRRRAEMTMEQFYYCFDKLLPHLEVWQKKPFATTYRLRK